MIAESEVLNYIKKNSITEKNFIFDITQDNIKACVFNFRFFEKKSFSDIGKLIGLSEAMIIHIYGKMMKRVAAYIYMNEKILEYKKTKNNQNLVLSRLPISKRLDSLTQNYTHLHEFALIKKQDFWQNKNCGLKSLNELIGLMRLFGLFFLDHDQELNKDYSLKI